MQEEYSKGAKGQYFSETRKQIYDEAAGKHNALEDRIQRNKTKLDKQLIEDNI